MGKKTVVAVVASCVTFLLLSCGKDEEKPKMAAADRERTGGKLLVTDNVREDGRSTLEQAPVTLLETDNAQKDEPFTLEQDPVGPGDRKQVLEEAMALAGDKAYATINETVQTCLANRDFKGAIEAVTGFPRALSGTHGAEKIAALEDRVVAKTRDAVESDLAAAAGAVFVSEFRLALELYSKIETYVPDDMLNRLNEAEKRLRENMAREAELVLPSLMAKYDKLFAEVSKLVERGQAARRS